MVSTEEFVDVAVTQPIIGLCHMQVCAHRDVPHAIVERAANRLNPAGTSNGWRLITTEERDEPGDAPQAPVECSDDPTRIHYLLVC